MSKPKRNTAEPDREEHGKGVFVTQSEDDCRCKETAGMTPRELLRRMMSDLAFWKKEQKN